MIHRGVVMPPLFAPLGRRLPSHRVPDEIRNLGPAGGEESYGPRIARLAGVERRAHQCVRTVDVGLNDVNREVAIRRVGGLRRIRGTNRTDETADEEETTHGRHPPSERTGAMSKITASLARNQ